MQHLRNECIYRLAPVILEAWKYYLDAVRSELLWSTLNLDIEKLQQKLQQSEEHCLELKGKLKDTADKNEDFERRFARSMIPRRNIVSLKSSTKI